MKEKLNADFNEMFYIWDNPKKNFYISKIYPITTVRILRNGVHNNKRYYKDIRESITIRSVSDINYIFLEKKKTWSKVIYLKTKNYENH